ncbi:phosphatidate cytidylyltransferase [Veillonella agrestimuris]|uniref:phosphatidate cytidylyltransferase n=1 Tax=Veillonella agrestimuris TaxID=2941340 RepID=UPI00204064F7|nr:phosphatidate cytidylyltransferase [Veillonella agrestimuris]
MLKTRVITAIIGFIIALGAITVGGLIYDIVITLLALLGWREFVFLYKEKRLRLPILWGFLAIIAIFVPLWFNAYVMSISIGIIFVALLYMITTFSTGKYNMTSVAYSIFGLFYVVLGFVSLLLIRHNELYTTVQMPMEGTAWGVVLLWLLLFSTWASDTFAYFAGRAFGKHRIVPNISPNKTLEGFIGGFIGCIITGAVYAVITFLPISMGIYVGIICGILAPLGDLFESKMKRLCNVKDSGVLLPGHGGVLDRFDSLLFTAPATLLFIFLYS